MFASIIPDNTSNIAEEILNLDPIIAEITMAGSLPLRHCTVQPWDHLYYYFRKV